jgi:hypothetical protein
MTTPAAPVGAPSCLPPRYSLLSVAEVEDRTDGHWEQGIEWDHIDCDAPGVVIGCPPMPENKITTERGNTWQTAGTFTLVAGYKCSALGRSTAEAWDIAGERLKRGEDRGVESVLWWPGTDLGDHVIPGSLADSEVDVITLNPTPGTAVSVIDGLALLEDFAGRCSGCSPIVHATRGVGVYMAGEHLVTREGSSLYSTGTGSRIVVGGGYGAVGEGPSAPASGEAWMAITGQVKILRGPTFFTPERGNEAAAIDRSTNDIKVYAERTYALQVECCVGAVLVALAE